MTEDPVQSISVFRCGNKSIKIYQQIILYNINVDDHRSRRSHSRDRYRKDRRDHSRSVSRDRYGKRRSSRSISRGRYNSKRTEHPRSTSRSPGDRRSRKRSYSRDRKPRNEDHDKDDMKEVETTKQSQVVNTEGMDEEQAMMALMGFGGFDSTKGKHVEGADAGAANIKLKRVYRQYMNRQGGFNRPLDSVP